MGSDAVDFAFTGNFAENLREMCKLKEEGVFGSGKGSCGWNGNSFGGIHKVR